MDLRLRLLAARTEQDFKKLLLEHMKELAEEHANHDDQKTTKELTIEMDDMVSMYLHGTFNHCYNQSLNQSTHNIAKHLKSSMMVLGHFLRGLSLAIFRFHDAIFRFHHFIGAFYPCPYEPVDPSIFNLLFLVVFSLPRSLTV